MAATAARAVSMPIIIVVKVNRVLIFHLLRAVFLNALKKVIRETGDIDRQGFLTLCALL
jgi:hypothetical protein